MALQQMSSNAGGSIALAQQMSLQKGFIKWIYW